jgi:HPt (histidine-containing phosphotransfer) domain-containing protein
MKLVAAINPKVIGELRALQGAGSPVVLADLIDLFLKEAAAHLSSLRENIALRDGRAVERTARTLKGSCGNLGAQAMSRICVDLQSAGHAAEWTRAEDLLRGLEVEFRAVSGELEAEKTR